MQVNNERVVITGMGVVASIGIGRDDFWKNLIAGKSGVKEVSSFDTSNYNTHIGGEIKDFKPEKHLEWWRIGKWGRATQFAIVAAKEAINDAKLDLLRFEDEKIGVAIGTTMGEGQVIEEIDREWVKSSEEDVDTSLITRYPGSVISENVSSRFKLKGPSLTIPTACAAGNYSIGYAFDQIKTGRRRIMIAGGTDPFSRIAYAGFNRLFATAKEKCRPFDKNRDGMVVGEGAGILILENLELALERQARIYAEILGYGLSCDAFHMTAPSLEGIKKVMTKALKEAQIMPDDVDYISAHGTGTLPNDKTESKAIKEVFNIKYKEIPVSSIKSMLGHTMGAASAIEAITCCLAIKDGIVPPTINYETPDPECDIDCVPNVARKHKVDIALNDSFAFGGNNACLVLKKFAGQ